MKRLRGVKTHIKFLIPALLTGLLVLDGLMGYAAPDPFAGIEPITQTAAAAAPPTLELQEQTETKIVPQGTAGKLSKVSESGDYADGVYTGSARGFGGMITVKVTIKDGKIKSIRVVSAPGESGSYLSRAKAVIKAMIRKQTTNVDAVSGATYSSNGIIKAVRNALSKASAASKKNKKKNDDSDDDPDTPNPNDPGDKPEEVSGGDWNDGEYIGTGTGFGGELKVRVTIEDGKIVKAELISSNDEEEYMNKALASILPAVVEQQGTGVDAVTGATFSSYGLLEAINDALRQASKQQDPEEPDDPSDDPAEETEEIIRSSWVYCDEYEDFDDYELTVTFIAKDGVINSISGFTQTGSSTNNPYIRSAIAGINNQLNSGIAAGQVDAVSGATCSSEAIIGMMNGVSAAERSIDDDEEELKRTSAGAAAAANIDSAEPSGETGTGSGDTAAPADDEGTASSSGSDTAANESDKGAGTETGTGTGADNEAKSGAGNGDSNDSTGSDTSKSDSNTEKSDSSDSGDSSKKDRKETADKASKSDSKEKAVKESGEENEED